MKLLHVYPATARIADGPRLTPGTVVVEGRTFYVWHGYLVYLDDGVTSYKKSPQSSYWCELREDLLVCVMAASSDEVFIHNMTTPQVFGAHADTRPIDALPQLLQERAVIADDPDAYTARETARIAARIAERNEQRLRQTEERKEKAAEATAARIAKDTEAFRNGEPIELAGFEALCKLHGVVIPIRTIGSARRNVSMVSATSLCCHGKGTPWALLEAAKTLKAKLSAQEVAA